MTQPPDPSQTVQDTDEELVEIISAGRYDKPDDLDLGRVGDDDEIADSEL